MNQKGFAPILVAVVIAVIAVIAVLGYLVLAKPALKSTVPISTGGQVPTTTVPAPAATVVASAGVGAITSSTSVLGGQTYTNRTYGVSFQIPPRDTFSSENANMNDYARASEFVNQDGVVFLGAVKTPQALYPNTNFSGGGFTASVNTAITNGAACNQFSDGGRSTSTMNVAGNIYSVSHDFIGGMGQYSAFDIFHTYKNNFCYEFVLEIDTYNRGNLENPSSVQEFSDGQSLENAFLSGISFSSPLATPPPKENATPNITSFTPSSRVAESGTTNNGITLSWTTQGVDYVQLSYTCANGLIFLGGATPQCQTIDTSHSPNYSPNGSTTIVFGNDLRSDPAQPSIPVTLTLTPFANGVAYPNLNKTIAISVSPNNQFPNGVPTSSKNMTLIVVGSNVKPGSLMKISWTDNNQSFPDSCVDLYLVQDNGNGVEKYRYQIVDSCQSPAVSGSYVWTVPNNYSGSGYHIFGMTPGGTANALSAPFSIVGN